MDRQGDNDGAFPVPISYTAGQVAEAFQFVGDGIVVEASDAGLPKDREPRTIEFWLQTAESVDRIILGYGTTQNRQVVRGGTPRWTSQSQPAGAHGSDRQPG